MSARKLLSSFAKVWLCVVLAGGQAFAQQREIGAEDVEALIRLRWTIDESVDPTNRLERIPTAIELGRLLFFDSRLSGNKERSCATCHKPSHRFGENLRLSTGLDGQLTMKTPPLAGVGRMRWFFHDGRADSLWGQVTEVIENKHEMGGSRATVAALLRADLTYRRLLAQLPLVTVADEGALFSIAAKSLAAFIKEQDFPQSRFDHAFRQVNGRWYLDVSMLSEKEIAGARLFVGKARCVLCHRGPAMSDGQFHNLGLPVSSNRTPLDPGRYAAAMNLSSREFNGAGPYSDDPIAGRQKLESVLLTSSMWGSFRTPSLRNVGAAVSFMHDGRFASLEEVVRFYSKLEGQQVGHHDTALLSPLDLSEAEVAQLVAFLRVFSEDLATK